MYGLDVGEDDQLLVETLHGFAEKELRGAARDAERSGATPEAITVFPSVRATAASRRRLGHWALSSRALGRSTAVQ